MYPNPGTFLCASTPEACPRPRDRPAHFQKACARPATHSITLASLGAVTCFLQTGHSCCFLNGDLARFIKRAFGSRLRLATVPPRKIKQSALVLLPEEVTPVAALHEFGVFGRRNTVRASLAVQLLGLTRAGGLHQRVFALGPLRHDSSSKIRTVHHIVALSSLQNHKNKFISATKRVAIRYVANQKGPLFEGFLA